MPVREEEAEKFRRFTREVSTKADLFAYDPNMTVWHYTNSDGLLGIVESCSIRATHVGAVNGSTETEYATSLYRQALAKLKDSLLGDKAAQEFLGGVLEDIKEGDGTLGHAESKYFVACFTSLEDDTGQWLKYGLTNGKGYAIGFKARGLRMNKDTVVVKVNYDRELHLEAAKRAAELTLQYYREGLVDDRAKDPDRWAKEFFEVWDQIIYWLAPAIKDERCSAENEFRMVHELQNADLPFVRFEQKEGLLGRYIDLKPYGWEGTASLLPITKLIVGPGDHKGITKKSAEALLAQMGYKDVPVATTNSTLKKP